MPRPSRVLTPELLKTFVTVIRLGGSLSRTAEALGINEASVSKRVKPLHEGNPPEIPKPWLQKNGKLFELTDEGRQMWRPAQEQLARWSHFVEFVHAGRIPAVGFACGQESAGGIALRALRALRKSHSGMRIRLATPRGRARIRGVALGTYDLALVTHDEADIPRIARRKLLVERLYSDPLVLVSANRGSGADRLGSLESSKITPKDLLGVPLVLPESGSGFRRQFDRVMHREGVLDQLNVILEVGGWQAILGFIREGFGVGLVPNSVAQSKPAGLLIKELPSGLAPANWVKLISRPSESGDDEPDLTPEGEALRAALREAAQSDNQK